MLEKPDSCSKNDVMVENFGAFHENFDTVPASFAGLNNPVVKNIIEIEGKIVTCIEEMLFDEINRCFGKKKGMKAVRLCEELEKIGAVEGKLIRAMLTHHVNESNYFEAVGEIAKAALTSKNDKYLHMLRRMLEHGCMNDIISYNDDEEAIHDRALLYDEIREYLQVTNPFYMKFMAGKLLHYLRGFFTSQFIETRKTDFQQAC